MFLTLITFFAILGLLVLVHEAGHFTAARRAGVKVEEFGLGLPPRIFGFYKNQEGKWKPVGLKTKEAASTIWSLNWVPLGGFVKIKGEEGQASADSDSFAHKSVLQRIWIISAGVLMNVILAVILLSISLAAGSPQIISETDLRAGAKIKEDKIRILEVLPNSPAQKAGLEVADSILEVDGQPFKKIEGLQDYMDQKVGSSITLKIERKDEILIKEVTPEILAETNRGGMGVALVKTGIISYPWYLAPWYGFLETMKMIGGIISGLYLVFKSLITSRELIGEVYGPVGIAGLVGDAVKLGFLYILQLTAALSVIIAVINFLPFPALDGGRVFFLLIEGLRGKPVNQRLETLMHNIGFALLMILVVIVTFRDIARISSGFLGWWQKISGLF